MNSVPHTDQVNVGLLLMVLVAIGLIIVLTIVISGRRLPEIVRAFAKLFVVGIAVLVIAGFFWSHTPHPIRMKNPRTETAPSTPHGESLMPSVSPPVVSSEPESAKSEIKPPDWTRQPVRVDGGRKLIVVSSGLFASEEEADLHGFQQATATAVKEFSSLDPRGTGAVQPQHLGIVKETAIKERFPEKIAEYDFGKFKAPMYQLWLQVELTNELGERLAEPWRQAAVEARLRTLTGWSLWGTAAAALAAFALRLDAAWNGRRRAVIAGTAIALTLGSLAFLA